MKIITWNCNMAFSKKAHLLMPYQPDILVIPECEHPDRLNLAALNAAPSDILWFGNNPNKGLGVMAFGRYKLQLIAEHHAELRTILPITVSGADEDFTLFAVWANHPQDKGFQYIGQVWKALAQYDHLIRSRATILAGDFNSNTIWDKPRREGNHSTVVNTLAQKGISSTYHHHYGQLQGQEAHPTFSLYRHQHRPYHLDYCFASADFIDRLNRVEVGTHQDWHTYSDHYPLIVDFG